MPQFYGAIDLVKNELRNAVIQNLGSAPATPSKGQIYFDSTANILYWYNGTVWVAAQSGSSLTPAATVTTQAIGDAPVVGVATNYAREDHKHGEPAFGAAVSDLAFGSAKVDGVATTISRADHTHGNPVHDAAAHGAISLSNLAAAASNISLGGFRILSLADPTGPTDGATKQYVDNLTAGLSWKESVRAATTVNGALATAYANGQTIDGVVLATGNRILLKNQTTGTENGIYTVNAAGAPTRATDADAVGELEQAAVFIQEGTVNSDQGWVCTTNGAITPGTTATTWAQFTGTGGPPTGAAGGSLIGSYPNPTLGPNVVAQGNIALNAVANGQLAQMTGPTIKGLDVGSGNPADLTPTQVTAILNAFTATLKGLVPASGGGTTTFLRADGTFAAPPAGTVQKYAAALTGTASPETVTHNLNTRDVHVTVYNGATPFTAVEVDWDATTVNTIVIRYNPNLGAGYRVVVLG